MNNKKSCRIHAFFLANIALGITVFAFVSYLIISGDYSNLTERKTSEAMLNTISLGSLIYAAVVLIVDMISRPYLCASQQD